jgi:hypothetical protein
MRSFRVAVAVLVATTLQARVVWLTNLTQVKRAQEAVRADRARQKIASVQKALAIL